MYEMRRVVFVFFPQVGYFLDESKNWGLSEAELERSYQESKKEFDTKVIVVINPGNPTGQVDYGIFATSKIDVRVMVA